MIYAFQVNMKNLVMPSEICETRAAINEKRGKKIHIFPRFRG